MYDDPIFAAYEAIGSFIKDRSPELYSELGGRMYAELAPQGETRSPLMILKIPHGTTSWASSSGRRESNERFTARIEIWINPIEHLRLAYAMRRALWDVMESSDIPMERGKLVLVRNDHETVSADGWCVLATEFGGGVNEVT